MKRKGFTLIELLIVIAIIGVLAAALYPTIRDALSRGRDAAREGDMNNLVTGIETFNADYGTYPLALGAGACFTGDNSGVFIKPGGTDSVAVDYFKGGTPPKDPSPNRSIPSGLTDPGGCVAAGQYYYKRIGANGIEYIIGTIMETPNKNNTADNPESYDGSAQPTDGDKYFIRLL